MGEGIGKAAGKHQLLGPEIGWGADGRLQWTALAVVIGIIEDRVGGADQPSSVAGGILGNPDARRKSLLLGRNQAGGNARISVGFTEATITTTVGSVMKARSAPTTSLPITS